MPEGHTIHRLARDQRPLFIGQRVSVSSPQGRFAASAAEISGRKLTDITAHGKHLFYHWGRHKIVHVHLGLYGKFQFGPPIPLEPKGAVRLRLVSPRGSVDLNGPNRCELLSDAEVQRLRSRLGPDPLREDADPAVAARRMAASRVPVGTLLLDQSVIAGIGNIFRAEILFLLGIHPERKGCDLEQRQFQQLWRLARRLLQRGVKYNQIITVPRLPKKRNPSSRTERFNIYQQKICPQCGGKIRHWILAARQIFACETCQR